MTSTGKSSSTDDFDTDARVRREFTFFCGALIQVSNAPAAAFLVDFRHP